VRRLAQQGRIAGRIVESSIDLAIFNSRAVHDEVADCPRQGVASHINKPSNVARK
jgi:hypothetical protein